MSEATDLLSLADERPGYLRCTKSASRLFVVGTIYEVHSYEGRKIWVATEYPTCGCLPMDGCEFVAHDPWAKYHARARAHSTPAEEGE